MLNVIKCNSPSYIYNGPYPHILVLAPTTSGAFCRKLMINKATIYNVELFSELNFRTNVATAQYQKVCGGTQICDRRFILH